MQAKSNLENTDALRFSILTLGCKVNQYESRAISEQLEEQGLLKGDWRQPCDIVIINTCAVTAESVRKSKQLVRRAAKVHADASILVMGCASQMEQEEFLRLPNVDFVCGTRNKNRVVERVLALVNSEKQKSQPIAEVAPPVGEIEQMRINGFDRTRAYVKIQDGCNGKCTYCIIRTLRGAVCSRKADEVLAEVRGLAANGCREVVLTGIETSAYEYDLADLIRQISDIPLIERIRLGSLDPSFIKPEFVDRIFDIPKVAPHFHLSLQSGSDSVLGRMRRRYKMKTILDHIEYLKSKMPRVRFSADVIVGFPGETEEEFSDTVGVVEKIGFLHLHIFPFSPRPGTEAAEMENMVADDVKTERAARLAQIAARIRDKELQAICDEGKHVRVLFETTDKDGGLRGHSEQFAEVQLLCHTLPKRGEMIDAIPIGYRDGILLADETRKESKS